MPINHNSRVTVPLSRFFVLSFISTLLVSGFFLLLVVKRKNYEFSTMDSLGKEVNKMFKLDVISKSLSNVFKDQIKHIHQSETTEDHCILYNFVKAKMKKPTSYEPISLALHSTITYAFHIISQANSWNDFISYSIYLYPGNEPIIFLLKQLHTCHPEVNAKVSMHLVWNRRAFQKDCFNPVVMEVLQRSEETDIGCSDFSVPKFIMDLKSLKLPLAYYPINIMRNEARRGAATKIHLIADIETKFSNNFAKNVRNITQDLLNNKFGKAVLVFRRFEMYPDISFPQSVADIRDLMRDKKLFQFHWYFFARGHEIPNLNEWFDYSISNSIVKTINQTYLNPEWEPQFIMLDRDPYHLEFVPTRFYDHQTLCNHLCRAGYNYLMMSHVFNVHLGIKRDLTPIELALSKLRRKRSPAFLRKFNTFLNKKHPKRLTKKKCPRIRH